MHSGFSGHGERKLATWVAFGGTPSSLSVAHPSLAHFSPLDSSGWGTMLTFAAPASTDPSGMLPANAVTAAAASPVAFAAEVAARAESAFEVWPEVVTFAGAALTALSASAS